MEKGYIQIYTGNGKGKTTAMLGLAVRAVGAGLKVYIGQFLKNDDYSEIKTLKEKLPEIRIEQYGSGLGFASKNDLKNEEIQAASQGCAKAAAALASGEYDLVILDEINVALHLGLIEVETVLELIARKPRHTELVLTGRYAHPEIMEKADLITEMTEIKHYYHTGVPAREGIEK